MAMIYVFDTSAWLTYIEDEPGSTTIHEILEQTGHGVQVYIFFMAVMEVFYISAQRSHIVEAYNRVNLILSLPITYHDSSLALSIVAAKIKSRNRVSNADSWMAALTKMVNGTLVHKDPEFEQLGHEISLYPLPYKKQR